MSTSDIAPLRSGWLIVDGLPMFHRSAEDAGPDASTVVHVHGFGISGTYMQPTAALLAPRFRTFVPDLPGHGRSHRPKGRLDLPHLAASLAHYCETVGVTRATFVGNSLGCPTICALANDFPELVERVVLVSPAGGPNNQPLGRALWQMALVGPREPRSMLPIAARDYLHFGVGTSLRLFRAMTRFPTVERLQRLQVPTLVVAGERDPLVRLDRVSVLHTISHVDAVVVPGAHALNYSHPEVVAALIAAHIDGTPLHTTDGPLAATRRLHIPD